MPISNAEFRAIEARAVAALEREFGTGKVSFKGGTLATSPVLKFEFTVGDPNQRADAERAKFASAAAFLHPELKPEHFGATFQMRGRFYTITGCNPQKPKYSIMAKRDDGKEFGFPAYSVVMFLPKQAA